MDLLTCSVATIRKKMSLKIKSIFATLVVLQTLPELTSYVRLLSKP